MSYSTWTIAGDSIEVPAANVAALTAAVRQRAAELAAEKHPYGRYDIDVEELDNGGSVAGVLANAGLQVYEDDGKIEIAGYDGTYLEVTEELLPLVAAHANPNRVDWVVTGEDGLTWIDRFENGAHHQHDTHIVPTGCREDLTRAYRALKASAGPDLDALDDALTAVLAEFGVDDPESLTN